MGREELINGILGLRPVILNIDELNSLTDNELKNIYLANRVLDYYKLLIKQQMIDVILYVYADKYTKEKLYMFELEDIKKMYLVATRKTEKQFESEINDAIESLDEKAVAENDDAYLSLTYDEKIIATGVIYPNPLLTDLEYQVLAAKERIKQIDEAIKEALEDNEITESALAQATHHMARSEFESDISANNIKINRLTLERNNLLELIQSQDDTFGSR